MAFGLGVLALPPSHFWSMTPREMAAAMQVLRQQPVTPPPSRAELDRLITRYPD